MNPFQLIGLSVTCSESKYFTVAWRLCIAHEHGGCGELWSLPRGACGELRGGGLAAGVTGGRFGKGEESGESKPLAKQGLIRLVSAPGGTPRCPRMLLQRAAAVC